MVKKGADRFQMYTDPHTSFGRVMLIQNHTAADAFQVDSVTRTVVVVLVIISGFFISF